ncbi:putative membrane protein [Halobacteriovorax marinus SJ]|uniref:Membrane protein n=1 Tax=Halobacteriovorax marinus (strain ATCC BAA-682 / DSM 15412 / SJ) TaxID=862908 RepID=E1WXM9_HALMS|nr:hypothetical protein [Halobacteriovorax marinus]CBW25835.1 putative membrane protein [Halobacteriovorax marinus SJ]
MSKKTYLIPSFSRVIPSKQTRKLANQATLGRSLEDFDNYGDWFFYGHVDPVQRYLHLFGMLTGTLLYLHSIITLINQQWLILVIELILATFLFYGTGVLSHIIYDKGASKSDPKFWSVTFKVVVYINLLTLVGRFDKVFREYVEKYPFTREDYQLIEVDKLGIWKTIFK